MEQEDRKALFAMQTERVAVDLVTLSYSPDTHMRLCKNSESIQIFEHGVPVTYQACGMEVTKPNKTMESGETNSTLRLSGIGSEYIQLIQELAPDTEITMTTKTIFADAPDEILDGPYELKVDTITLQSSTGTIEISSSAGNMLDYMASTWNYTAKNFPAIWT